MLLSDPTSRRWPLHLTRPSPPSGWPEDLHLQTAEHAQHTTNPLRGKAALLNFFSQRSLHWRNSGQGRFPAAIFSATLLPMSNNIPFEQSIATARKVSPLRQRMIDDMMVRNFAPNTMVCYLNQFSYFARHFAS